MQIKFKENIHWYLLSFLNVFYNFALSAEVGH